MSKALRLSEKWFRRALWLVAVVFASFLIGLGGQLVGDLPHVEQDLSVEDFMPSDEAAHVHQARTDAQQALSAAETAQESAQLEWEQASTQYRAARDTFNTWVATRTATARPEQDEELIARTHALEGLKHTESAARDVLQQHRSQALQAQQALQSANRSWSQMLETARPQWQQAQRMSELRVFLYRLALTLPLLIVALWLFKKQRHSTWWPFVWGFIGFAVFAFFVELVPYLPSYGGYVRYVVGLVLTVLVGRWAIVALQRYLERQRQAEAMPAAQRRTALAYDAAQAHVAKGVCPGCERSVNLKDGVTDFCPHCGIGLFDRCTPCGARKSAFTHFCHACGARAELPTTAHTPPAAPQPDTP